MTRLVAALVLMTLAQAPAAAEPAAEPSAADRDKARELTERAIGLTRKGSFASAIPLYQRAYELSREAVLLSNIGSAYRELGERDKALGYFCLYLENDPAGVVAAFAREQAKRLASDAGRDAKSDPCQPRSKPATTEKHKPAEPPAEEQRAQEESQETEETEETDETDEAAEASQEPDPAATQLAATRSTRKRRPSNTPAVLTTSGVILGAVGVAAAGGAGYYAWVGKRAADVINGNRDGWTESELDEQRRGQEANSRAKLLGIAGGAAIVTGVALIVWGRAIAPSERRLAIVPSVGGDSQGLALLGVFD